MKDIFDRENLFEVPKDKGFNLPNSAIHQDKSTMLVEKCNPINVGDEP